MKPPPFDYARPATLPRALELLAEDPEETKLLAGGQSLVPLLNFRMARPRRLVDIARLGELAGIGKENGALVVGACVTQREASGSPLLAQTAPLVTDALRYVGHAQTRSRGTIGGSIAHADPAAELPAVAVALGAELIARSATGERTIRADDFFAGPLTTALAGDEVLTHVRFPSGEGRLTGITEFSRRHGDFAVAGVAVNLQPGEDGRIVDARIVAFGLTGTPLRLGEAEAILHGQRPDAEVIAAAADAAERAVDPPPTVHLPGTYRRRLLGVLVSRVLSEVTR